MVDGGEERLVVGTAWTSIRQSPIRRNGQHQNHAVPDHRLQDARQSLPIIDLPLPTPLPDGAEWIEAYRRIAVGAPRAMAPLQEIRNKRIPILRVAGERPIDRPLTRKKWRRCVVALIQELLARVGICGLPNSDTSKYTHSYVGYCDMEQDALRTVENHE